MSTPAVLQAWQTARRPNAGTAVLTFGGSPTFLLLAFVTLKDQSGSPALYRSLPKSKWVLFKAKMVKSGGAWVRLGES